jgi:hypothetical protein
METRGSSTWRWLTNLRDVLYKLETRPDMVERAVFIDQGYVGVCYYFSIIMMLVMSSVARKFFIDNFDILVKKCAHIPRRHIDSRTFQCMDPELSDVTDLAFHAATMLEHVAVFAEYCTKLYRGITIFKVKQRGDDDIFTYDNAIGVDQITGGGRMKQGGNSRVCLDNLMKALDVVSGDVGKIDTKLLCMTYEQFVRLIRATSWDFVSSRLVGMSIDIQYFDERGRLPFGHSTCLAYCSRRKSFIVYNPNHSDITLRRFPESVFVEKSEREFHEFIRQIFEPTKQTRIEIIPVVAVPSTFVLDGIFEDEHYIRNMVGWQPDAENIIQFIRVRGYDGFATQSALYLHVPGLNAFVVARLWSTSPFLETTDADSNAWLPSPSDFTMRILNASVDGKIRRIDSDPIPDKVCRRPKSVADRVVAMIDDAMRCERPIVDCRGATHFRGRVDTSIVDLLIARSPSHRKRKPSEM